MKHQETENDAADFPTRRLTRLAGRAPALFHEAAMKFLSPPEPGIETDATPGMKAALL
ncbi:MAG: hypothetical protein ABSH32_24280 [Bryobacteraceae bacterium]